jgi:hypothetical protein
MRAHVQVSREILKSSALLEYYLLPGLPVSGKRTTRPCASFSLADPTGTIAAFTSRHSASHGRLGKKRTTGLDGFDEFWPYGEAGELRTMQAL